MKKPDKFRVGDTAWARNDYESRHNRTVWIPCTVAERTKTGYVMNPPGVQIGTLNGPEKVSTIKANRAYLTTAEKDERDWIERNRWRVIQRVQVESDAMIRQIADLIGYKPAKEPHA